jgi:two-component system response regulator AtoC
MMTAHGTLDIAQEAWRAGIADFVRKPFDREEMLYAVRKALRGAAQREQAVEVLSDPGGLLGESAAVQAVKLAIERAATSDATVLIRGESGTGKEVAARALHDRSPRRTGSFVKVHCAALPEDLLANELFGHEKDAFTGATGRRQGRVDLARGGTLFLDEIGDVSLPTQVKLLQLVQDREFERLGAEGKKLKADVRFVCATHRNLEEMIQAGKFREDLFYRLNVLEIRMPPLRERPGDVERLAKHFCQKFAKQYGRPLVRLEPEALSRLCAEPWPGNVRQLQNCIERMIVMSDRTSLGLPEVERHVGRAASPAPIDESDLSLSARVRHAEKEAVQEALRRCDGNRLRAARLLGIGRRTLYAKLAEYGIE